MSLTPIVEAFGMVALLFIAVGAAAMRWTSGVSGREGEVSASPAPPPAWKTAIRIVWLPATAEAFGVALLAALWFGSLGHGGWLLVFLLVGALAAGADRWTRHRHLNTHTRQELKSFALGLLKYAAAGWLCAWRLTGP